MSVKQKASNLARLPSASETCEAAIAAFRRSAGPWRAMIDASIVPVPTQRNSREANDELQAGRTPAGRSPAKLRQKDRDARWTKKHGRSFFGYKNHGRQA